MANKMTLLSMVQDILSAMDSDEVNSIGDTTEALQVAREVRNAYENLATPSNIPEHRDLVQLEALGDTSRPNVLRIPDSVKKLLWFKYNHGTEADPQWHDVCFVEPGEFISNSFYRSEPNIFVGITSGGVKYSVFNNNGPTYWTTFDDEHIICNGYNSSADDTLQSSKTMAYVETSPVFLMEDTYVPDLDGNLFPLLLAEAKKACFINFKQVSNANEEQRARRQLSRTQNDLNRTRQRRSWGPDYSRKGPKG